LTPHKIYVLLLFIANDQQQASVSANPHLSHAERRADQRAQDAEYYRRDLHNLIDLANMVYREA